MKRYKVTIDGNTFDVAVLDDPRGEQVRVQVDGEILTVGVESIETAVPTPEIQIPAEAPQAVAPPETGTHTVVSPLPGIIKAISVRPGQSVAPDDKLLVIEAMKMENIIRATRPGTVSTIHVVEGRQVAYGEPLLDVD